MRHTTRRDALAFAGAGLGAGALTLTASCPGGGNDARLMRLFHEWNEADRALSDYEDILDARSLRPKAKYQRKLDALHELRRRICAETPRTLTGAAAILRAAYSLPPHLGDGECRALAADNEDDAAWSVISSLEGMSRRALS